MMSSTIPAGLTTRGGFVIESRQLQRTLLAIFFAGPFFVIPTYIDGKQLVLQTIFIAVLFALIVNIP